LLTLAFTPAAVPVLMRLVTRSSPELLTRLTSPKPPLTLMRPIVFVLMSDEDEPGVQPEATIDAVVASLRYDNSV
jgi:hypothetical protein